MPCITQGLASKFNKLQMNSMLIVCPRPTSKYGPACYINMLISNNKNNLFLFVYKILSLNLWRKKYQFMFINKTSHIGDWKS